jgi:hypothetical protein
MTEFDQDPAQAHFTLLLDTHGMVQLIGSNVAFLSQQIANSELTGT